MRKIDSKPKQTALLKQLKKAVFLLLALLAVQQLLAQLTISSFSPTSGPIGTTVTITGTNFSTTPANNIVYFGDVKATVIAATSTSLSVTVPLGASYEPITVTTNSLTAYSSLPFNVTYQALGTVLSNSFTQKSIYPSGPSFLSGFCIGDLDGDGKPDLVVFGYKSFTVLKSTGTPRNLGFDAPKNFAVNEEAAYVKLGDLDGDGKLDLVVASNANSIYIFKNTSTSDSVSFASSIKITSLSSPCHIAIGDLDGDGKPDLAVGYWNSSPFSIYRNTSSIGSISFASKVDFITNSQPINLDIRDLNGDGKADLAITNAYNYSVSIYKNTSSVGNIDFAPKLDYVTGYPTYKVRIDDLDGDNKPDFIVGYWGTQLFSVFKNTSVSGNISFASKVDFTTGSQTSSFDIGDLDGDGKPDISIPGPGDSVSIFKNTSENGKLSFAPRFSFNTYIGPKSTIIGDFDVDGHPDLVIPYADSIIIFRNLINEPPHITSFSPDTAGAGSEIVIKGKYFGHATGVSFGGVAATSFSIVDSVTIKAVVGAGASDSVSVTSPNGRGTLGGFTFTTMPIITSFSPKIGGVGSEIIITGHNLSGTAAVSIGGIPAGSFTAISPTTLKVIVGAGSSGDISVTTPNGTVNSSGFVFTTKPVVTSFTPTSGPIGTTVIIKGGNFDTIAANNIVYFGDIRASVTACTMSTITTKVPAGIPYHPISVTTKNTTLYTDRPFAVTFPGIGATFAKNSFGPLMGFSSGDYPIAVTRGDADGDGKLDLVVTNHYSKTISIYRNISTKGAIKFAPKIDVPSSFTPWKAILYDLDKDGKQELIVSSSGAISVYKNTGTTGNISFGSFAAGTKQNFYFNSSGWETVDFEIRDLDGDGKADIAATGPSLVLFRNNGGVGVISFESPVYYSAGNSNRITIDDLNGDGRVDIVVSKQGNNINSTDSIYVFKNQNGTGPFMPWGFARTDYALGFNQAIEDITSGDLDGDSKPELVIAVNQTYTANVYRNTSTGGTISFAVPESFGTGEVPYGISIEDMGGDGIPDLVMSNFSNGDVSVLKNKCTIGTISFAPHSLYAPAFEDQFIDVCTGDLDGDGKPDVALAGYYGDQVVVMRNTVAEARVVPSGANPVTGDVLSNTTVDSSVQTYYGNPYVQRHYDIEPANNPSTSTATVTLYFTQQEFTNYNAFPGHGPNLPSGPGDTAGIAALRVYQYHGFSTSSLPGSYSGSAVEINPVDSNIVWNATAQWWEVTFDVNGFSGFFIGSAGSSMAGCGTVASGTASFSASAFCSSGSATLSATGYSGTGVRYQWEYSNDNFVSDVHDLVNQANPATGETGTVTATTYYRLRVSCAVEAITLYSNVVTLTQNTPPSITTQPANQVVCEGSPVTLTVAATGNNPAYQWKKDGADITGATSADYTINNVTPANAGSYSVVITSGVCSVTSSAATVAVHTAPAITTQPAAQVLCSGSTATFSVVASGTNPSYQWKKDGAEISGATAASYTINNAAGANAGSYTVVVMNSCGTVTSNAVTLTVNPVTTITTQPAAVVVCANNQAGFAVAAQGLNLAYQWKKNGVDITGATATTYQVSNATAGDMANYSVVVSGTCGTITSNSVSLIVNPIVTITAQPTAATVCANSPASFLVGAAGVNLTYQWRKNGAAITGATSASYQVASAAISNAGNYDVVVSSTCGTVSSNAMTLTVNATTIITTQPAAQSVCANNAASFTVAATGTNLTYQWRKNTVNITGATGATYTINNTVAADATNYDVVVTGACGTVTSSPVQLVVNTCTAVPVVDADVTGAVLIPSVVHNQTVLRLTVKRAMKVDWTIVDINGKVVRSFSKQAAAGRNDINLSLNGLSSGTYLIMGSTSNGRTEVLRFVKL